MDTGVASRGGRVNFLMDVAPGRSTTLPWMSLVHSSIWAAQSGVDRLLNAENKEDRKLEGKCGGGSGSGRSYREELGVNTTVNIGREKHPELKINLKITLYHF